MQTIVELPEFHKRALSLLKEFEKVSIINYLALHPKSGDLMQGTGGIRKLRWSAQGKGKSGGVRVIYYYVTSASHIRLLLIYKKGKLDNLTDSQKAVIRKLNEDWQ